MNEMKALEDLVRRLDRIAKANEDEFRYSLVVSALRGPGIVVRFEAVETTDGHIFVSGIGDTQGIKDGKSVALEDNRAIEDAVEMALSELDEACKQWGYKNIE